MTTSMKRAWAEFVQPILRRPPELQVAALCYRETATGETQVLLITSRGTGRWIVPKGWPMEGKKAADAALQEAWEEAGVTKGATIEGHVGSYAYDKHLDDGYDAPVEVEVFKVRVKQLADIYPEHDERTRRWVRPTDAAEMVQEPGLKAILLEM
ncbi:MULTISPECIES: NUDIX hydrolase [unclassified Roseovarius]|uniref:NUDIX hydrolase n=1 Tax=unclassified Roseovarius TaxID=2614913 RepID=UPI00273F10B9|nr:NUDIX hydrolase [Roseovarius sp. MMSF_3350]